MPGLEDHLASFREQASLLTKEEIAMAIAKLEDNLTYWQGVVDRSDGWDTTMPYANAGIICGELEVLRELSGEG